MNLIFLAALLSGGSIALAAALMVALYRLRERLSLSEDRGDYVVFGSFMWACFVVAFFFALVALKATK